MAEESSNNRRQFDLADRTAEFGEAIVGFDRKLPRDDVTGPLIRQLVRSGTSIGANYTEADEAGSPKEFSYRISVCCREARETQYWLRMLAAATENQKEMARTLWQEANELTRIFGAINRKTKATPK
ncbi:MAG: four helix bundle protein [Planctomycetaceae bacterium]|nr:four helix bundle protein [Planctomycetaceae bacterium]